MTRAPARRTSARKLRPRRPLLLLAGSMGSAAFLGSMIALGISLSKLPDVSTLQNYTPYQTTEVVDRNNRVIADLHGGQNRVVIPLSAIPINLQDAVIAIEDSGFYHHGGIDLKSVLRAALTDLIKHRAVEGGSTLTQQLAKNLFLTPTKALSRKIAEAYLAIQIDHRFTKPQILELYLNQVYWGDSAYGVEAAAQNYFGISSRKLDLAQSAMLAGMLRGPSLYSPYNDLALAKFRQGEVLKRMVETGYITAAQARAAKQEVLHFPGPLTGLTYRAPYFVTRLEEELIDRYGADLVLRGGLRVVSTLDLDLQDKAEALIHQLVKTEGRRYHFSQAAMVALDPKTGGILAMVGGDNFQASKFNRVTQALRQPGSSFKPFLYLTAFAQGWSPDQIMNDNPASYSMGDGKVYTPHNYDNERHGNMPLKQALWESNNVIAVKLLDAIGVYPVIDTAHRLGIESPLGPNLSLALGSSEVTPLEMASAYGVFANDGVRVEPQDVTRVEDRAGSTLEVDVPHPRRVFDAGPIRTLDHVMEGVILHGTGMAGYFGRPAAGKTGTTSDLRDAWFVGFTPQLVCAVWVGNDDNAPMWGDATGGTLCAPLWGKFMRYASRNLPVVNFPTPPALPPANNDMASGSANASASELPGAVPIPLQGGASAPSPDPVLPPDGTQDIQLPSQ